MSLPVLTHEHHITVKTFASVPALGDLPEIQQPGSVSKLSPLPGTGSIDLAEGCILTKSVKYTHQLTHWVNSDSGNSSEIVSRQLIGVIYYNLLNAMSFRRILWNMTCV